MAADRSADEAARGARTSNRVSRRTLLKGGLALGAAGTAGLAGLSSSAGASIERAMAMTPSTLPTLSDIRHVVFLMQENRSFDHYFGTLSGVRGFSDPKVVTNKIGKTHVPVWDQYGYQPGVGVDPTGYLQPFELQQQFPTDNGDCTNDISHEWGPQHQSWDGGKMDAFVQAHLAADGDSRTSSPPWATSTGRNSPSITPWPMPSPSATPTTARCSGPPTPIASWPCRAPSTPPGRPAARSSSPRPPAGRSSTGSSPGPPCPSSCSMPV